jgi:hypothetical protein
LKFPLKILFYIPLRQSLQQTGALRVSICLPAARQTDWSA